MNGLYICIQILEYHFIFAQQNIDNKLINLLYGGADMK